ncbi:hypothetical protein AAHH72_04670 [Bacillus cereus]
MKNNTFSEINQYLFCSLCIKGEIIIGGHGYRFHAGEESGFPQTHLTVMVGAFTFEKEARY